MTKTKCVMTYSIDVEVVKLVKEKTTQITNKSAYINNLLRQSLGLSYIEIDN